MYMTSYIRVDRQVGKGTPVGHRTLYMYTSACLEGIFPVRLLPFRLWSKVGEGETGVGEQVPIHLELLVIKTTG